MWAQPPPRWRFTPLLLSLHVSISMSTTHACDLECIFCCGCSIWYWFALTTAWSLCDVFENNDVLFHCWLRQALYSTNYIAAMLHPNSFRPTCRRSIISLFPWIPLMWAINSLCGRVAAPSCWNQPAKFTFEFKLTYFRSSIKHSHWFWLNCL